MSITLDGTSGITSPTYGGATTAEYSVPVTGFKNRIINGAMVIDQRNAGASVPTPNGYIVDRFAIAQTTSGKITAQQNAGSVTPPVGFTNYLGVTVVNAYSVTSSDIYYINQSIEGYNTADLAFGTANAQTVTLSFWVRSSLTGTYGVRLVNATNNRSYVATYSISSANTWEQKSITIAGDTSGTWVGATNGIGIGLLWTLAAGSNFQTTANSWQSGNYTTTSAQTQLVGTSGATFYITGVQLEKGSTATSFDYRAYGTELSLCQRYYQKVSGSASWPYPYVCNVSNASSTLAVGTIVFPTSMRATPTISFSTLKTRNTGSSISAIAIDQVSVSNGNVPLIGLSFTTTFLTIYYSDVVLGNNSSSAYIDYSAEL